MTHMAVDGLVGFNSSGDDIKIDSSVQYNGSNDHQVIEVRVHHANKP